MECCAPQSRSRIAAVAGDVLTELPFSLGDSGFLVIRGSSVAYQQRSQTHFFNCPLYAHCLSTRLVNGSDYIADNFLSSQYQKNASPERASIIQAMQIYAR